MKKLQGTANENAVSLRRICKRSDQLKNKHEYLNARLILRRKLNLTRQRHERDQTKNQLRQPWTAVSSYLALVNIQLGINLRSMQITS